MKTCFSLVLTLVVLLTALERLRAQQPLFLRSTEHNEQPLVVSSIAEDDGGPLFLSQVQQPRPGSRAAALQGTVNQLPAGGNRLGTLEIGFDYVRPLWSFRDFLLVVPAASANSFPLLGSTGHVDNHFVFAPRVDYNYQFADSDFGISASGSFLNLSGQLNRQVNSTAGGVGRLTASSQLTIVSANLVEFTGQWDLTKPTRQDEVKDYLLTAGIGTRYSSIDQNYTGSLTDTTNASNVSTRFSTQSFRGIGITGSLGLARALGPNWLLFSNTRASILYGDNKKDSTVTVNVAGQPGQSSTIDENRTTVIPILEFQAGAEWTTMMRRPVTAADNPPLFGIQVSFVGQYWPDVGPLSAGSTQAFRRSDLFLLGLRIMAGFGF